VHWNNRGKKSIVWRCAGRLEEKGSDCGSPTVPEEELQKAVLKAINSIIAGRDEFIETLRRNIETALGGEFDESTEAIDKKLEELQHELLRLASTKAAYDSVANEIYRLRELRQETLASNSERQNRRQRIAEMMEFLNSQSSILFEFDDKLVRRIVNRVTVYGGRLKVEFKTGTEVSVEMYG
jgi:site-specific DNA recombinase